MRLRQKVLILLGLLVLLATLFLFLKASDGPKYHGLSPSDWLSIYDREIYSAVNRGSALSSAAFQEADVAVRAIGTNALPYYLKWICYESPSWRRTLRLKLPARMAFNPIVDNWLEGAAARRARYAGEGIGILGTKAVSAIPALEALMKDRTRPESSFHAIMALGSIGEQSVPVLMAALADPQQPNRSQIVNSFHNLTSERGANACLAIVVKALTDKDASVRTAATNVLKFRAPSALTNAATQ